MAPRKRFNTHAQTHTQKKIRKGVVRGKRANSNTTRLLHHVKTLRENGNGNKRERERENAFVSERERERGRE